MLAKKDEERYLSAIQFREKMAKIKEQEDNKKKEIDLMNNKTYLDMQMNERIKQMQKTKDEEKAYAEYIKKSNVYAEEERKRIEDMQKGKVMQYKQSLL